MNALQKLRQKIFLHARYQKVFQTEDGREVLEHIMHEGFMFKSTFVAGDQYQTALNEGKRMFALAILRFLHKDHAEMVKQIEQAAHEQESNQSRRVTHTSIIPDQGPAGM